MTWKPGDSLPDNELWTQAMVAQYAKCSERSVRRMGIPRVPGYGRPRYEPATVRAWFSNAFQRVGVRRAG